MSEKEPAFTETNNVDVQERTSDQNQAMFESVASFVSDIEDDKTVAEHIGSKIEKGEMSDEALVGLAVMDILMREEKRTGIKFTIDNLKSPIANERVNSYVGLAEARVKTSLETATSPSFANASEDGKKQMIADLTKETDQIYQKEIDSRFPSQEK